jgi:hypothetical protein
MSDRGAPSALAGGRRHEATHRVGSHRVDAAPAAAPALCHCCGRPGPRGQVRPCAARSRPASPHASGGACRLRAAARQPRPARASAEGDRFVGLLAELAAAEPHAGRRYELLVFADECGLTDESGPVEDEPQHEEPDRREWVRPEDR